MRTTYDAGAAGLGQLLRRLQTTASAMHVAAHPDDEDSAVIARLTRGDGARVAYLSLTRGEGGQNIIGRELFEALGVIRTEELLQARRLDGGTQLFTRAMDFGYTKSRAETAEKWGEREVLGDMVRAIRAYRPFIIFSRFSGTGGDGHGQHQMAGYLAPLAYRAASDPGQFPEQIAEGLRPWQVRKFYVGRFGGGGGDPKSIRVETGLYDTLLGRSYFQIAMEGRSQHKSQEMGREEWLGSQGSVLHLIDSSLSSTNQEQTLFDGIDTSISGIASVTNLRDEGAANLLREAEKKAREALSGYDAFAPQKIIPALAEGLRLTRRARAAVASSTADQGARYDADFLLARKESEFSEALKLAAGVNLDALADTEIVAPGESLNVAARAFLADEKLARVKSINLQGPDRWEVQPVTEENAAPQSRPSFYGRETPTSGARYRLRVPADAAPTQPYWLQRERRGYLFSWPENAPQTKAVNDPLAVAEFTLEIGGADVTLRQPVEYRFGDRIRGELRRDLNVAPALTLALDPKRIVLPLAREKNKAQRLAVRLTSYSQQPLNGTLSLQLPAGWSTEPASAPFALKAKGERTAIIFQLAIPPGAAVGAYPLKAVAITADGRQFDLSERTIAYQHIQTHRLYATAQTNVEILDLRVAPVRVGYVVGSGDDVPEAIKQMGLSVTTLDENELSAGDLSRFDVIVVGVRASEVRPDLISNNGRLLEYAREGGTLIVQYQQYDYIARNLAPYPAQMAARVTDEDAPVTILQPEHPIFNFPNKITASDWQNWVHERSLYNFTAFDAAYTPLLEAHDPGEGEQRGGQVYARLGRGHYVYTSYSWFRQLPAGVPGAYRLFANLLSLAKAPTTKSDNLGVKGGAK